MTARIKKRFFVLTEIPKLSATAAESFIEVSSINKFLKRSLGTEKKISETLTIFDHADCKICLVTEEFDKLAKEVNNFVITSPEKAEALNKEIIKESDILIEYTDQFEERLKEDLSVKELTRMWSESFKKYAHLHEYSWFQTLIDFKDNLFTLYLQEYISSRIGTRKYNLNETFVTLTTPVNLCTAMIEEQEDLRKIKEKADKKNAVTKEQIMHDTRLRELIREHAERYCWLGFNFIGPAWTEEEFVESLLTLKEKRHKNIKEEQEKIMDDLDMDEKHRSIFTIAQQLVHGKEYRKEAMFRYYYILHKLFDVLSKKINIPVESLRFIFPKELKNISFDDNLRRELRQRQIYVVNHTFEDKSLILSGKKAREYTAQCNIEEDDLDSSELRGMTAFPGFAEGKAKIINRKEDLEKIKEGEILISIATNPDLLPGMRRAAAIVTDIGGITCHAAIVSRELKIPCIVGTKKATKIIKDGDYITVDATKGEITLKRSP